MSTTRKSSTHPRKPEEHSSLRHSCMQPSEPTGLWGQFWYWNVHGIWQFPNKKNPSCWYWSVLMSQHTISASGDIFPPSPRTHQSVDMSTKLIRTYLMSLSTVRFKADSLSKSNLNKHIGCQTNAKLPGRTRNSHNKVEQLLVWNSQSPRWLKVYRLKGYCFTCN